MQRLTCVRKHLLRIRAHGGAEEPRKDAKQQNKQHQNDKAAQATMLLLLGFWSSGLFLARSRGVAEVFFTMRLFSLRLFALRLCVFARDFPLRRPLQLPPWGVGRTNGERRGAKRLDCKLLKLLAVHSNGVAIRLDAQRLLRQRRIGKDDVAFVAFAERHGDAFDKRDFSAPVRSLDYLQYKVHSLTLRFTLYILHSTISASQAAGC